MKVAINGFGRMGRLGLRAGFDDAAYDIVAINEITGGPETAAHLLEFDSVQGRWRRGIDHGSAHITVGGSTIAFSDAKTPADIPWTGDDVDVVLECTGRFKTVASLQPYFEKGIKKVIVSAPVKEEGALNLVMGVNQHLYDPAVHDILTAASCTTNCLAPVVKVVHENIGIVHGSMTTIHDVTNTQVIVDKPMKDLRRSRSALNSLIPTTTGSATAITIIYPELKGKLNGHAVRVPLLTGSLTDCVFEVARDTSVEEVNALMKAAAEKGPLEGILGYEEKPLVSSDFVGDPRSGIVDALSTMVVDRRQVKIYAWYDNEWGYMNRMMEMTRMVVDSLEG
ncbi:MAG: ArsJ-associated glyceraldehyde-3-phosphate dehydrogenase [Alphaproteobacteria bacterium]|nr:ArsJ-associated glyceraldehyde-3-phosphate dehydrogenase [Alphaproteobacteria bacterium]